MDRCGRGWKNRMGVNVGGCAGVGGGVSGLAWAGLVAFSCGYDDVFGWSGNGVSGLAWAGLVAFSCGYDDVFGWSGKASVGWEGEWSGIRA